MSERMKEIRRRRKRRDKRQKERKRGSIAAARKTGKR